TTVPAPLAPEVLAVAEDLPAPPPEMAPKPEKVQIESKGTGIRAHIWIRGEEGTKVAEIGQEIEMYYLHHFLQIECEVEEGFNFLIHVLKQNMWATSSCSNDSDVRVKADPQWVDLTHKMPRGTLRWILPAVYAIESLAGHHEYALPNNVER
ncbi:hypothetical protein MPER_02107, partial [Moniliophthora perniciosa FA553]